ncbi:MAG: helix-turn-helix domain-containing protein [Planctomycetia bacterium]|uniref:helix-turn-helix domain-containing protein n=1 Tax=Candidatus Kuenenia sp. TaxID=2499824 RepID=UPI001DC896C0|nr:helix-turn-helix domain-containing protein [Planctomycetia bacterium]MCL4743615.1 helix-turn-helix domain-containing protein [Phycisphaerales bacterium]
MAKKKCLCDFGELTDVDLLKAMQLTDEDLKNSDKLLENLGEAMIITKKDKNKMNNSLEEKNKMKVGNNCEIFTVKETADFLKIPISTVYQWTMRKTLPVCKMGKLNRYRKADLINFISQNMQT